MQTETRRVVTALVVAMTLLGAVPASVTAQGTEGSLLLNQGATEVGAVTVDGERYQVYRYDNTLPYASGVSVYSDGEQVTSAARVRAVLTALAQRRAAAELGPEELETLRSVRREARVLANESGRAADALANATGYAVELQSVRVDGTTAWNATVEATPAAAELNETAGELVPALRRTERHAGWAVANTTALIDLLERKRNGSEVDPRRLYARYDATLSTLERLSDQEFDIDQLSDLAGLSRTVAANASSVPERGDEIAGRFASFADRLGRASNRTTASFEAVEDRAGFNAPLLTARTEARTQQAEWMEAWETRRYAPRDIYGTLLGVPLALVLALGYVRRRR